MSPEPIAGEVEFTLPARWTLALPGCPAPAAGHPLVVALHGAREDGARLRARLPPPPDAPYAVLWPDGPYPVEVRDGDAGRVGCTWYQYTGDAAAFVQAMAVTGAHLERVIGAACSGRPLDRGRVAFLGYSQGGYLAAYHALRRAPRPRALVAIACGVKVEALGDALAGARGLPVLAIHGERDEHVKWETQRAALERLRAAGAAVETHLHPAGHGLRPEFAALVDAFLRRALGV